MNQPLGKVHLFRASQIRMEQTLFNFICVRMQIRRYLSKKDLKPSKFSGDVVSNQIRSCTLAYLLGL